MTTQSESPPLPAPWQDALRAAHFARGAAGYQKNGLHLELSPDRCSVEDTAASPPSSILQDSLSGFGLWKWVRDGGRLRRVFELPPALLQRQWGETDNALEPGLALGAFLAWAEQTAHPDVAEWVAPDEGTHRKWLGDAELTVQRGAHVRQGRWVAEPGRLALEFPLVLDWPRDLPATRWGWLEEVLLHAQSHWHMLRFGLARRGASGDSLVGRVDLTAAPSCPELILTGLEALKYGTAWLVETAELLADVRRASQVLAVLPNDPQRRKDPSA